MRTSELITDDYLFSIVDDESGESCGYFHDLLGLSGDRQVNFHNGKYHQIELKRITPINCLQEWCLRIDKQAQFKARNFLIGILDKSQTVIGSYFLGLGEPIECKSNDYESNEFDISLIGRLQDICNPNSLALWDIWRDGGPSSKNIWSGYSFEQRRAWLEIVGLYQTVNSTRVRSSQAKSIFHLDGSFIVDYPSFFCAIGEAINGPGGYFGKCIDSLSDCLGGGYGAVPPFTLVWQKSDVAQKMLDKAAWVREKVAYESTTSNQLDFNGDPLGIQNFDDPSTSLFEVIKSALLINKVDIIFD